MHLRVHAATKQGANPLVKLGSVLREKAKGDFGRVFKGAEKTRERLSLVEELLTYWNIDEADDQLEELEDALIGADFGPKTALKVVDALREDILAGKLKTGDDLRGTLRASIVNTLRTRGGDPELNLPAEEGSLAVILVVGVNGGGKTTTVGKLAHKFTNEGAQVRQAPAWKCCLHLAATFDACCCVPRGIVSLVCGPVYCAQQWQFGAGAAQHALLAREVDAQWQAI